MKIDGFLLAMLGAVLLAILAPGLGASHGPLHLSAVSAIGIAIVFFLHGAALSPNALRAGAANWRLHLLVHASTFLLFPAIGLIVFAIFRPILPHDLLLGFFFLCALSSTISSSVAMTALGKGNVSGAVFDATLSGLIGMILTPALVSIVTVTGAAHVPLLPAILDVFEKLLVPFAAGQLLRPVVGGFVHRNKRWATKADRTVIVLIVYSAFCDSTAAGIWSRYGPFAIGGVVVMVLALLATVLMTTTMLARLWGFSRADEVAAVFCGSKKSLANGAPIASVLFGNSPALGMIMLPLMLYHQAQLIVCSILARRYAARADEEAPIPTIAATI